MEEDKQKIDLGFTILINPPFQDANKKDDQFYHMINIDTEFREVSGIWTYLTNPKQIIMPYYSGFCRRTIPGHSNEHSYIITGGVQYDGRQENPQAITIQSCFRLHYVKKLDHMRLKYETHRLGKIIEKKDEHGNDIEVQEEIALVPDMNYKRHNHQLFEIKKQNIQTEEYLYYAIGGQYIDDKNSKYIYRECEVFDEKQNKWKDIAPMNFRRAGFSGFVHANKIYVFGGHSFNDDTKQSQFLSTMQSEEYDPIQDKWTQLKFRWKTGMQSQLLGALCMPISENHILIVGGSNGKAGGPTQQLSILDMKTHSVEFLPQKIQLSIGRARAYGKIVKNKKVKKTVVENDKPKEVEEIIDMLVIFGGAVTDLTIDFYQIMNYNPFTLEYLESENISKLLKNEVTQYYSYFGLQHDFGWAQSMLSLPVLLYSDYE